MLTSKASHCCKRSRQPLVTIICGTPAFYVSYDLCHVQAAEGAEGDGRQLSTEAQASADSEAEHGQAELQSCELLQH